jgi:hypothetical protein
MKLGEKYLCANGMIAHIDQENIYTNSFTATMRNTKGEILYSSQGYGWTAAYNKDGSTTNEYLKTVKKLPNE